MTITQVWAGYNWYGNVFFLAPDDWDLSTNSCVQLGLTQDAYVTNSTYVCFWNLTRVGSTRLYYVSGSADHGSWNKEYVVFVANPSNWGTNSGITISSCACYTSTVDYGFSNNDNPYLFTPSGSGNLASISGTFCSTGTYYGDRLGNLINKNQVINLYTNGSASNTGGSVNISGVEIGVSNGSTNSVDVTSSGNSVSHVTCLGSTVTLTATPAYGYEFQGWYTASSGGDLVSSDAEYSYICKDAKTLYARFTTQYAYIQGRFRVYNAARNSITTTYDTDGQWDESSDRIKMSYDDVKHVHYIHTYMTPKELSADHGSGCDDCKPYFYIKTSSSSSSLADVKSYRPSASGQTITAAGTSYKKAVSKATSSHSLRINSTDESGYVVLYFDGASDVWYEIDPTPPSSALDISAQTSVTAAALITANNATQSHYLSTNTDTLLLIPSDINYNIGNGKKNTWAAVNGSPSPTSKDWSCPVGSVSYKGRTWWKSSGNINTLQVRSDRTLNIRVTGCKTVSVLNSAYKSDKYFVMEAYEYDDGYTSASPAVSASNTSTSVTETSLSLNSSKEYVIVLRGNTTDNNLVYEIKFIAPSSGYTVSIAADPDGYGTVSASSITSIASGTAIGTSTNTLTVTGKTPVTATAADATDEYTYDFDSWTLSDGTALPSTVTEDLEVYANFTRTANEYTLTWTTDGDDLTGDYTSGTVAYGTAITQPNTPTKTGYTFSAWSPTPAATMPAANTEYTATWTCTTPTISASPSDATVCKDATKPELSVTASANGGTLTYQWYSNTTKSTSDATLLTDSTKAKMYAPTGTAGTKYYYCVVTNGTGTCSTTATSSIATVTVKTPVSISSDPSDVDNAVVSSASSLSVTATGTGTLTYQWQTCDKDDASGTNTDITSGSAYSNYNTATLSFTPGSVGTYYFRCKVTDDCGNTVYSNVATVTAKNNPTQYSVSGTASICSGNNTDITLSDSEDGVTYKLYKGGVDQSDDKVGDGDALTWNVSAEGTYTVKAEEDEDYWERTMSGSAVISYKTTTEITTQPTTAVAGTESVNFTLGSGMVVASSGTKTYQWYSYSSSGGADETEIDGAELATYTTSQASAGTYYYKVGVTADCGGEVKSNMITVTVTSGPCFTMTANTSAGKDASLSHNDAITASSKNCATLTGGTAKYVNTGGSGSMTVDKSMGWKFNSTDDQIIVTLSAGYYLQEGSVITMSGHANASSIGIQINGKNVYTKPSSSGDFTNETYTVLSTDEALLDANILTIKRHGGSGVYLSSISISGCNYCEPIEPSLTYSKTTFWLDEESDSLWCSPTLDKDESTGTVTYSSSNSDIVWVGSSTGNIYAQGRGVATITASIAADGTHCASEATCKIIVKSIKCGTNTIAEAVLNGTNSTSSLTGGTLVASGLKSDSPDFKLNDDGAKFGITMSSAFKVGDIINFKGTMDASATSTTFAVYASTTASSANLLYSTTLSNSATINVNIEVTEDNLTLLNTSKTVAVIRTKTPSDGQYNQNPHMKSVHIKRYTCPDILVFNDEEDDGSWSTAGNWMGKAGQGTGLPKDTDRVYIKKSVTVDATTAVAARVHITNGSVMTVAKSVTMGKIDVETGSTLHVAKDGESAVTLSLKTLHLVGGFGIVNDETKYDMPRVYIDPASTITKTNNVVNFDIAVDNRSYYPFALPFDVPLVTSGTNAVDYANSYFAYYSNYGLPGGQYGIKTYNGQKRANYGSSSANWEQVSVGTTLKAGRGYALSAMPANASGYNDSYAVIRFPMVVDNAWTATGELGHYTDDKSVEHIKDTIFVPGYKKQGTGKGTGDDTPKTNRGWNLLGVPYMSCYQASADMYDEDKVDDPATLIQGRLNYTTGKWEDSKIMYVTVPNHDFSEYIQADITDAGTILLPGWCFFVQVADSGYLTFLSAKEAQSTSLPYEAPRRANVAMQTVTTGIVLSGNGAKDKTTILVSDRYSAEEYEINADLEKMFGENGYSLATYSLMNETRLAYNAMSNADIMNNVIPIGYRAPADGEYTFSINPRYAESEAFQQVNLIDYQEGTITNLLTSDYTFATERTQNDGRFALNVIKAQEVTTDIEATGDEQSATGIQKVIINDKMYIIRGQEMYDVTGKRVKGGK